MKWLMLLAFAVAWLTSGGAYAQVTYQSGATTGPLEGATVTGAIQIRLTDCTNPPWYFWIDRTSGEATTIDFACPIDITIDTRSLADGAHFIHARNDPGARADAAFTVRNAAPAPVFVPMAPPCLPTKLNYVRKDLPAGLSQGFFYSFTWPCDLPTGYRMWTVLTRQSEYGEVSDYVAQYLRKKLTLAQANELYLQRAESTNAVEAAYIAEQNWAHQPLAVVAMNGITPTRPVFAKNPDGTRNMATRSERVAITQPDGRPTYCDWRKRLVDAYGRGTGYLSVEGRANVATADPNDSLPELYTLCSVTSQLGFN